MEDGPTDVRGGNDLSCLRYNLNMAQRSYEEFQTFRCAPKGAVICSQVIDNIDSFKYHINMAKAIVDAAIFDTHSKPKREVIACEERMYALQNLMDQERREYKDDLYQNLLRSKA